MGKLLGKGVIRSCLKIVRYTEKFMSRRRRRRENRMKNGVRYVKKYKMLIVFSLVLTTIVVLTELYIPILIASGIDLIVGENQVNFEEIYRIVGNVKIFTIIVFTVKWLVSIINNKVIFSICENLRNDVLRKLQKVPLRYIDSHSHGEIVSRVISDVDQVSDGLLLGFTQIFSGILTIILTIFFMFSLNPKMAWVVVILSPLSLLLAKYISKKTYSLFKKQSEIRGEETGFLNEMITNQKTIVALGEEEKNVRKFQNINQNLEKVSVKALFFSSITNPSTRFVNNVVYAVVTLFGAFIALAGNLTVGGLSCFLNYANQYTKPFNEISSVMTELQNAMACLARILKIIEEEEEVQGEKILENVKGNVVFQKIDFGYSEKERFIKNLNFSIEPGQKVAIVGPTGCGKTTLMNLLMRFYDVTSGKILVDGENIQEVNRKLLRKSFGMVLQEAWMKNGTVLENIKLGKPEATEEEVEEVAKEARSYEMIQRLPNGFDTVLENNGSILSEGEKQLISITRILLLSPPMLILDEATSNIDTRTELQIQEAFDKLMKGRTSFIVAHRLSTIVSADVILVMKNGEIIEQGRHEELLEKNGFYAGLYESQFGE